MIMLMCSTVIVIINYLELSYSRREEAKDFSNTHTFFVTYVERERT